MLQPGFLLKLLFRGHRIIIQQNSLAIYDRCLLDADQNDFLCARLFRDILAANNFSTLLNDLDTFQGLLCAVCNPDHWPLIPQNGLIELHHESHP